MVQPSLVYFADILRNGAGNLEDSRMDLPLMLKPLNIFLVLICHNLFVLYIGPKIMKNREAFSLKNVMIFYNVSQIIGNGYICFLFYRILPLFSTLCIPTDRSSSSQNLLELHIHYTFFLLKYWDLVETWIYVLRKKNNQVSFLHVYHHTAILLAVWLGGRYFPGGQFLYIGLFNSPMHCLMYMYYLIASLKSVQTIWWKKYITQLQIIQHTLIVIGLLPAILVPNCDIPKLCIFLCIVNILNIVRLFIVFYKKNYRSPKNKL